MAEYTDNYGLIEPTYAELADIDPLNGNFETIDEIMHASQVSLADAYDLTATYNTGDVVMYQYYMYKCKEDNVTGAWDATKWERTTAGANGSGGGGTEVVANPVGTPTEDLQTIEIAGTIYDIPGGGGSGGGGSFKITNLWNYTDDNSGTIPYGVAGPFTLRESLANYDAVFLELVSDAGDLSNQWRGSAFTPLLFITALDGEIEPGNINFTSYDQRSSHFVITRTTVECTASAGGSINGLVNVWGVKFAGSGAFSAEVIPITAGDGTTSRTFSFNRQPKSIKIYYKSAAVGYNLDASLVWGQDFINYLGHTNGVSISGGSGGLAALSYGVDGKSFTITGGDAFGALNDADGAGFMFVDYGEGGGGASKEILYTNATNTNPATISLTDDYSNFDILSIRAFRDADSIPENSIFLTIDTQLLQINQVINILGWAGSNEFILYKLTASDELTLIMQGSGIYIREIAGVKN